MTQTIITRIAFGSCAKQWQHQTIWDAVFTAKPDFWLFLGDTIYGDTDGKTAWLVSKEQMTGEWNRLADKPEFQKARAQIPMMAIWDNHDYGSHAGGAEFTMKEGTKRGFPHFLERTRRFTALETSWHLRCQNIWAGRKTDPDHSARYQI